MKQWQYRELDQGKVIEVFVTKGKHKGKVGVAQKAHSSDFYVSFDHKPKPAWDDSRIPYRNLEVTDGKGNPCEEPVRDMTGREIQVDTWLAYSVNSGQSSHGLEIGKVVKMSETGGLTVKRMLRDGDAITAQGYWSRETRIVNDTWRALVLPVDTVTMTTWVLKDFDNLKYGDGL